MAALTSTSRVDFLATPWWQAKAAVERAKRAGRKPVTFYVAVLEAHEANNAKWIAEQEALRKERFRRERLWRAARGGAFGKDQQRW